MPSRHPIIFLDRDGTLIEHIPYLGDPARVALLPTVAEGLARMAAAGWPIFLHTNQSGISRGYFDLGAVEACNRRLIELLGLGADLFKEICIAPELPGTAGGFRKPSPRFAEAMLRNYGGSPEQVVYIGDAMSDLLAGKAAGGRGIGLDTGETDLGLAVQAEGLAHEFPVFSRFVDAVDHLMRSG